MKITRFLVAVVLTLLLSAVNAAERPPNVLFIMADDLGFSDIGCYGGEIETPVLDSLADGGLRYTQFYNCARCWPTRAALMSGYYPQQVGRDSAPGIRRASRPAWAQLLPQYLKAAGYRSYHSGKWHIDSTAMNTGFDHSYDLPDQNRFHSPRQHTEDGKRLPPVERGTGYYATTEIADRMIKYLKEHQTDHADKPFFGYLAFISPHFPLHALPEDIERVGDRYAPGWDVMREGRWERIQELGIASGKLSEVERDVGPPANRPESYEILGDVEVRLPLPWDSLTPEQQKFQATKMALHAAMVERTDIEIGRVLDQLRAMDAFDDTLVVFLSDNGASAEIIVRGDGHDPNAAPGSADSYLCLGPGWSTVANTPFRRHKTWTHEGGSHTPFIAHWPKGIAARGELRRDPGHAIDLVPTVLDLVGVSGPDNPPMPLPGQSLTATFAKDTGWQRALWFYHQGSSALRVGDWKAVMAKGEKWELFNLANDCAETNNLAASNPEKLKEITEQWESFRADIEKIAPKAQPKTKRKAKKK